jgi:uncharacterized protein (TIGR02266 family)
MTVQQRTQRRYPRIRTSLVVHYGTEEPHRSAHAETLSEGGLCIRTNDTFKVGTRLALRIDLPERAVCMRGEVVWSIQVPQHLEQDMACGMGIRFLGGDADWPALFRRWREDAHAAAR